MLTAELAEIRALQDELAELRRGEGIASARGVWRGQLDDLRPEDDLTTDEVANKYRKLPTEGGGQFDFETAKFPYIKAIHDALDDPRYRLVLVKGPARSLKTTAAENHLVKIGRFGPSRNVLWYMHSTSDLEDYVEERGEFLITNKDHGIRPKVGKTPRENSRLRKKVDGKIWRWLAANKSTTRGKAAPYIVVDEVDAMRPDIRKAITTLIRNRQREFGNMAKAYIASHSDEGPNDGIDKLLVDSDLRVRMWRCEECDRLASPAAEAPDGRRVRWNVADLMEQAEGIAREDLLDFVAENVALVCPHCQATIDNEQRLVLDAAGEWMGKGQRVERVRGREEIVGDLIDGDTAGFVIHAFMSRLPTLASLAREYAAAMLNYIDTGDTKLLKEVFVKSLGETFRLDTAAAKRRDWKTFRGEHVDTGFRMNTVPRGVDFVTGFVDCGGAKFDVGLIGWSRDRESWILHRRTITEYRRPGDALPRPISPGDRLSDWDVLEKEVLFRLLPLNDGSGRVMELAKLAIDTGGVAGITANARMWAANLMARDVDPVPAWRIALLKGQGDMEEQTEAEKKKEDKKKGELYTRPRIIDVDDAGRPLPVPVIERTVHTNDVKTVAANRMEIKTPGPGFIHLPADIEDRHVREFVAEAFENKKWVRRGANELWDIYIGSEVARSLLAPDNAAIDWDKSRPGWASPFTPGEEDDIEAQDRSFAARLAALSGGANREEY